MVERLIYVPLNVIKGSTPALRGLDAVEFKECAMSAGCCSEVCKFIFGLLSTYEISKTHGYMGFCMCRQSWGRLISLYLLFLPFLKLLFFLAILNDG